MRDQVAQHLEHDEQAAAPADDQIDHPQGALGEQRDQATRIAVIIGRAICARRYRL